MKSPSESSHTFRRSWHLVLLAGVFWMFPAIMMAAAPALRFAPLFNDRMVLQCEMPVNVWGSAHPGEQIQLQLDGRDVASAVTDSKGHWGAVVPSQAPGGPHRLVIRAGGKEAAIENVHFGEVWLAAGQSNMGVPLSQSTGGENELTRTIPGIRYAKVPFRAGLPVGRDYTSEELAWKVFEPGSNREFSAVAFHFAEMVHERTGRTVGIVQSLYGGTPAEAWVPKSVFEASPRLKYIAENLDRSLRSGKSQREWVQEIDDWDQARRERLKWREKKIGPQPKVPVIELYNPYYWKAPTVLFENMIRPIIPFTARGVIWYQGEGNIDRADEYRILFPALIAAWRQAWGRSDWPFLFVQLSALDQGRSDQWAALRAVQAEVRDTVPNTGMALSIDVGDKDTIHPASKKPVGERLALLALSCIYQQPVISRGPLLKRVSFTNPHVIVEFDHVAGGLISSDGRRDSISGFELAGPDGVFRAASAQIISKNEVQVTVVGPVPPASVRYAWRSWVEPPLTLQNSAGLPAEPFLESQGLDSSAGKQ